MMFEVPTVKEAMREALLEAAMPLTLKDLSKQVASIRPRRSGTQPTTSAIIANCARLNTETFYKFGPFVALREWDQPEDYARFIERYRGVEEEVSLRVPVGTTPPPQVAAHEQQQQVSV